MSKLNKTAKLAFYQSRKRVGDVTKIARQTGFSASHISNVLAGRRTITDGLANHIFRMSRKRIKNSELTSN